ncbi:hypothetical protein JCM6882_003254 [Rhodosporidiobolus microsporus]
MHRFWDPVFEHLHSQVISELARPTLHGAILPLFHLNQHFRYLILKRMLARLNMKPSIKEEGEWISVLDPFGGAYLRMRQAADTFDEGLSHPRNDPRELFMMDFDAMFRGNLEQEDQEDNPKPARISLFLSSFNEETHLCTFKPIEGAGGSFKSLTYSVACDPDTGEEYDYCDAMPGSFQIGSAGWFRAAKEDEREWSHGGLMVAGKAGVQPSRQALLWPKCSQKRGGTKKQPKLRCTNGWTADVVTKRLDDPRSRAEEGDYAVFVRLEINQITLPLFDVFFPPTTAKDDLLESGDEYTSLGQYLEDEYKKTDPDELETEEVQQVFLFDIFW